MLWIGIGLVLKFGELNDDDDEPDAQMAARSIGGMALYAKATEPQEFGELKFGETKFCELKWNHLTEHLITFITGAVPRCLS